APCSRPAGQPALRPLVAILRQGALRARRRLAGPKALGVALLLRERGQLRPPGLVLGLVHGRPRHQGVFRDAGRRRGERPWRAPCAAHAALARPLPRPWSPRAGKSPGRGLPLATWRRARPRSRAPEPEANEP